MTEEEHVELVELSDGWFALGMAAVCFVLAVVSTVLTIALGGGIVNIAITAFGFFMALVLTIVAAIIGGD